MDASEDLYGLSVNFLHEYMAARSKPRRIRSARSSASLSMRASASANASASRGPQRMAAPPAISGRLVASLQTTGQPEAIASSTGMPNPSKSDGKTRAAAPR